MERDGYIPLFQRDMLLMRDEDLAQMRPKAAQEVTFDEMRSNNVAAQALRRAAGKITGMAGRCGCLPEVSGGVFRHHVHRSYK